MNVTRRFGVVLAVFALAMMVMAAPAAAKKPWEKFKFPELGGITMPDYQKHTLANGMTIYLMPDDEWPLVEGRMLVRTGSAWEPGEKVGLAEVTGDVLRTGGTTNISADDLDEKLERMGAYIESGVGETSGNINFSFLNRNADEGLALVADVMRNPAFEEDKIDVALTAQRSVIARRNDELNPIVSREIQKAVWGEDHPYARTAEYATLDKITRDDMVAFYEYYYHPNNAMLAVWGDFDSAKMIALLEDKFGDWPMVDTYVPDLPDEPAPGRRRVLIANKDDVTQARFAIGHVGMRADDPDYYSMNVMNRILGGGFGDRLFNEVRSNLGYAYNVGSSSGISWSRPGTFQAYCGTKSGSTEAAMAAVLGEIDKIREAPVTDTELTEAKDAILNSHVFNFVSKSQILNRMVQFDYWGYPADFMETYPERIKAVDKAQVLDVAQRRVKPDQFAIVAVGKTEEWDGDLTAFGPVEELDISIPEPEGEEFPDPTDETIEKGRGILAQAAKAHGNVGKLASIRRVDSVDAAMGGMSFALTVTTVASYPDQAHTIIGGLPFGEIVQAVSKDSAWSKSPQGIEDVPGDRADKMRTDVMADPIYLLGNYDGFQVQSLPNETVNDVEAEVVLVRLNDTKWIKIYFDPSSRTLVKSATMGDHPMTQAPGLQETYYSDIRTASGIKMPYKSVMMHDGEQLFSMETTEVEVNPSVNDSMFMKPSS